MNVVGVERCILGWVGEDLGVPLIIKKNVAVRNGCCVCGWKSFFFFFYFW